MLDRQLRTLVEDEYAAQIDQLRQLWQMPLESRLSSGYCQRLFHFEKAQNDYWVTLDSQQESRFREGDLLRLHWGNPIEEAFGLELMLLEEQDERWRVQNKRNVANAYREWQQGKSVYDGVFYADSDQMDLRSFQHTGLNLLQNSPRGQNIILPLLQNRLEIGLDPNADYEALFSEALELEFNAHQAEAIALACSTSHLACIQGPPGTGKTRVLAQIVENLIRRVDTPQRILITAHTHLAINNALNRIAQTGVPVVKIGDLYQRRGLDSQIESFASLDAWGDRPHAGYVVGATPFAAQSQSRLRDYEFDTVIFDEASQMTLPLAIMAMNRADCCVFIGDQKQLPPILHTLSILSPEHEQASAFAHLTNQNLAHSVMLNETYRMNAPLTYFPSEHYYQNRLRSAPPVATKRYAFPLPASASSQDALIFSEESLIWLKDVSTTCTIRNPWQAEQIGRLAKLAHDAGLPLNEMAVVCPFRAQAKLIRKALKVQFGVDAAQIVCDTVERMQGQERELIFYSLPATNPALLQAMADFLYQPQRLNVSITRAKTKLITLAASPDDIRPDNKQVETWVQDFRDFLVGCIGITP